MASSGKRALVPISDGTEDLEVVTIIDVLRRGGIETVVAGLVASSGHHPATITGARGVKIVPDVHLGDPSVTDAHWDAIVLAGGMPGAQHFHESKTLNDLIKKQAHAGRTIGAICASPAIVLAPLGLLADIEATCFPFMHDKIPNYVKDRVKKSGHIITSQGPGTAVDFALEVTADLVGRDAAAKVANGLLVQFH